MCIAAGCSVTPAPQRLLCEAHWDQLWGDLQPKQVAQIVVMSRRGFAPGVVAQWVRCSRAAVEFVLWGYRLGWSVPRHRRTGSW